jgi:predicted peptidase
MVPSVNAMGKLTLWLALMGAAQGLASDLAKGSEMKAMKLDRTETIHVECRYWLGLPPEYDTEPNHRWPLLVFLHGAGERGEDLKLVLKHGPPKLIAAGRTLPMIVAAPQCPAGEWWENTRQILAVRALVDELLRTLRVEPNRVYLTGLSMGGYGTWRLAAEYPELWAAIVPICGGGRWFYADRLRHIPTWVFHGAKDPVVPLRESEVMVEAIRKAGGTVRFTVFPEAGHDAWTAAYDDPALYEWLLQHSRSDRCPQSSASAPRNSH